MAGRAPVVGSAALDDAGPVGFLDDLAGGAAKDGSGGGVGEDRLGPVELGDDLFLGGAGEQLEGGLGEVPVRDDAAAETFDLALLLLFLVLLDLGLELGDLLVGLVAFGLGCAGALAEVRGLGAGLGELGPVDLFLGLLGAVLRLLGDILLGGILLGVLGGLGLLLSLARWLRGWWRGWSPRRGGRGRSRRGPRAGGSRSRSRPG